MLQLPQHYHLLSNYKLSQMRNPKEKNPSLQHVRALESAPSNLEFHPPKWRYQFPLETAAAKTGDQFLKDEIVLVQNDALHIQERDTAFESASMGMLVLGRHTYSEIKANLCILALL